jgi:hypothetical protein
MGGSERVSLRAESNRFRNIRNMAICCRGGGRYESPPWSRRGPKQDHSCRRRPWWCLGRRTIKQSRENTTLNVEGTMRLAVAWLLLLPAENVSIGLEIVDRESITWEIESVCRMAIRPANSDSAPPAKRQKPHSQNDSTDFFVSSLLSSAPKLAAAYAASEPYKHAVVDSLFDPEFLQKARQELLGLSFREKETDIYRVCRFAATALARQHRSFCHIVAHCSLTRLAIFRSPRQGTSPTSTCCLPMS